MAAWDYENPNILELKYEDVVADEKVAFDRLFSHYGFHKRAKKECMIVAESFSFKNVDRRALGEKKKKSHLRSGEPGEWREFFKKEHKLPFKKLNGEALIKLGYEVNNDW